MPTMDFGLFVLLTGLGLGFTFVSLRMNQMYEVILKLFAMLLFFVLALFLVSEYDIVQTETDGLDTWTTCVICSGHQIIGMIFLIIGLINAGLFFHFITEYREWKREESFYDR